MMQKLEDAAERYAERKSSSSVFQEAHKKDFIAGAKWQQERMYSEEEVEKIFKQAQLCAVKSDGVYFKYETFEQFKKK
jgi:hypothetical protein